MSEKVAKFNRKQQQQKLINVQQVRKDAEDYPCPHCGHDQFEVVHRIKRCSKLASSNPTGGDLYIPDPYFKCLECGHILSDVRPIG